MSAGSKDKWWIGVKQVDEIQFVFREPIDIHGHYLILEKEPNKAMMRMWAGLTLPSFDPGPHLVQLSAPNSGLVARSGKCNFWIGLFNDLRGKPDS